MDKKKVNFFKIIIISLFLIFIALYLSSESGYYDFEMRKKTILTEEKIKEFESDVKAGKNVELTNYAKDIEKDYRNNLSKSFVFLSKKITSYVRTGVETIFKFVDKVIEDEE